MAAILSGLPAVSDDDLIRMTNQNPGWKIERTDDGRLRLSPTHTDGGAKIGEAFRQLRDYAKRYGGKAYDSSTGFKTPRGGVLSPDAAWISAERVAALSPDLRRTFRQIAPDVVIEVALNTDSWPDVTAKIDSFYDNGAAYAVAIDPDAEAVYERGTPPAGLALDLAAITRA